MITTAMTISLILVGSYSRGYDPRGASVPLHPQRRDVHTVARHTIYKHLIEKSNATRLN